MSQEIFSTCPGQVLRQLCMEVLGCWGSVGGEVGLGGRANLIPWGQREQQVWWPWGLGGLEADRLGEDGEAGGVGQGLMADKQAWCTGSRVRVGTPTA